MLSLNILGKVITVIKRLRQYHNQLNLWNIDFLKLLSKNKIKIKAKPQTRVENNISFIVEDNIAWKNLNLIYFKAIDKIRITPP